MPAPYEVWQTRRFQLGNSVKDRPAICLRGHTDDAGQFLPCSSRFEHFVNAGQHFEIPDTHANFAATGLRRRTYVIREGYMLEAEQLDRVLGVIEGELRAQFDAWLAFAGPAP